MELGLLGALLGGALTLLSPCSVMLLPAFFSYAFTSSSKIVSRTGIFYLGLITTLVPLGVLAGTLGAFVNMHREAFVTVASIIVIVLGVIMAAAIPVPYLTRAGFGGARVGGSGEVTADAQPSVNVALAVESPAEQADDRSSALSVYALGTVYGLAGVCAGPLLGAVLTLAALGGNALYGGVVLLVFAFGMTLPLLLLAMLWNRLPFVRTLVRPREVRIGRWRNTWTQLIGGVLTIAVGVLLIVTSGTASLGGVLGATDQARLEGWVLTATGGVSDLVVLGVVAAVGLASWLAYRVARSRKQRA